MARCGEIHGLRGQLPCRTHAQGFRLVRGSADHLTITVEGTRADAERAFALKIGDYRIGKREFYANATDPALPAQPASRVQAVIGLSNLAKPKRSFHAIGTKTFYVGVAGIGFAGVGLIISSYTLVLLSALTVSFACLFLMGLLLGAAFHPSFSSPRLAGGQRNAPAALGTGQTIGLIEFASFQSSDVSDYLNLIAPVAKVVGLSAGSITNLSVIPINGGAPASTEARTRSRCPRIRLT